VKPIAAIVLAVLALASGQVLAQAKAPADAKAPAAAKPAAAPAKPTADAPADNMQILRDKVAADKKLVVAAAMDLSEKEAKAFWPVYEEYQKELYKINDGLATLVSAYAQEFNAKSLTDEKARQLLDRYFAIEDQELKLRKSFIPKVAKVLPGRKVARYMQLENKIRALVKYELAGQIPLAE
jgi:hypothetical protein